jgi:exonuclease SbcD
MKILHTSDWHLGKRLEGFSRLEEQEAVLAEILEIAEKEKTDAVIIAGDLFDTFNPPTEAVELFYKYLKKLSANGKRAVIAIAGNHDSPDRIEAPDPLARECGIIFAGYPNSLLTPFRIDSSLEIIRSDAGFIELRLPDVASPLRILLTPYAHELRLKTFLGTENAEEELRKLLEKHWSSLAEKYCDDQGVNILLAHLLFATGADSLPEEPEEERSINFIGGAPAIFTENIPGRVQYVALGHLHRHQTLSHTPCPVVYTGSPLAYSFSEADQDKFVVVIDAGPGQKPVIEKIRLNSGKRLIRRRFEDMEEAVSWLDENQDIFVELTIVSDQYLATDDRKRLMAAHPRIVAIIPESKNKGTDQAPSSGPIDLTKSMEELFIGYFKSKKGQEPGENIINLFREIIAEEDPL